jgi:hypothetical protein
MRSHVKTVDSVYETLNNACRASNANTQALQYTIAGLVAFMRLSAPIVATASTNVEGQAMEVDSP